MHQKWHFSKQKQREGQTQTKLDSTLSFWQRILKYRNIWQQQAESLAFQVWSLDRGHHPAACQKSESQAPPDLLHQNQHLHKLPGGSLGIVASEKLWAVINAVGRHSFLSSSPWSPSLSPHQVSRLDSLSYCPSDSTLMRKSGTISLNILRLK